MLSKMKSFEGSEELTKFILKKTRESVLTLANEANRQLDFWDNNGLAWKNITSDNPIVSDFSKSAIEVVVYMHYIIAELAAAGLNYKTDMLMLSVLLVVTTFHYSTRQTLTNIQIKNLRLNAQ